MKLVCLLFGIKATPRFVAVSNEYVNTFSKQHKDDNNKKKMLNYLKIFKEFPKVATKERNRRYYWTTLKSS